MHARANEHGQDDWARLFELIKDAGFSHQMNNWEQFYMDLSLYVEDNVIDFTEALEEIVQKWENAVVSALSDPLPPRYFSSNNVELWKARPASRRYPYSVSGDLASSVRAWVDMHKTGNTYSIKVWTEIFSPHAQVTNSNITKFKRKDGLTPRWKGWMDRVFEKGDAAKNIVSVNDIFNELSNARQDFRPQRG